ncbi:MULTISPECIES: tyrosine-type recombinase/integrase [unclassified Campylobacter]|uniref:tyrosine-type recombinase/integrase n=1 Tax=unclassified Campylobacter TaxID=2593542 RepID=UPI0022E9B95D|nr:MULTISPECIES: tyrosine-type recombinase/integrase [unclassified Campylobacter]MDA3061693.1 tyrosine-type recombinase/integrase [Campylobacter sp. JMF_14 EL1]MDA3073201.1 tyrosine-type recombinase/integrase [Campylobacter sp. JMF_10 EL2]
MKQPLDAKENFASSLLFWMAKFVRYKLSSLSNKELKNEELFSKTIMALAKNVPNIEVLSSLAKDARNAGLTGINTYFNPLFKLYNALLSYELESMKNIDEELLSEVLASITGGLSDASKKNYRIAVINFFGFIDRQNETNGASHNYGIELKSWGGVSGNRGVKLPEFLSEDEISKFIGAINSADFKKFTHRNRLILKVIIYTGIRVGEAINLRRKDISEDGDLYVLRIRGKGNKYRVVMIKKRLIQGDLDALETNFANKDDYVFTNKKGSALTQAYISRIVEKLLLSVGIRKKKNGAHMLRHTFATMLYKREKDLVLVQEALGHASLNTSRIYTHFDNEKLRLAAMVAEDFSGE